MEEHYKGEKSITSDQLKSKERARNTAIQTIN